MKKRQVTENTLKSSLKVLILQEVRHLQMEHSVTPRFMAEEIARSIQEAKKEVSASVRGVGRGERNALIKKMLRQSLDEEIDRAIELRRNRCLRCTHARYHDGQGTCHAELPCGEIQIHGIGCVIDGQTPGVHCTHYTLSSRGVSLGSYLEQMTLLYELREMFDEMEEVWDYLTK